MSKDRENKRIGLHVKNLSAGYGKKQILKGISFLTTENETVGILGANGSGKTTLLKAMCGLLPYEGEVFFSGQELKKLPVRELSRLAAYIPQRSGITISIPVIDAVLMGFNPRLPLLAGPDVKMREKAMRALASVGLSDRAEEDLQHLSEGQKQLCMLARTMVTDSRLLLLDEPESALDFGGRYRLTDLLRACVRECRGTAIVTLHDPQLAVNSCDRLILLKDGRVLRELIPERDTEETMAAALSGLYGPLSVHRITGRNGKTQFVLIREDETAEGSAGEEKA